MRLSLTHIHNCTYIILVTESRKFVMVQLFIMCWLVVESHAKNYSLGNLELGLVKLLQRQFIYCILSYLWPDTCIFYCFRWPYWPPSCIVTFGHYCHYDKSIPWPWKYYIWHFISYYSLSLTWYIFFSILAAILDAILDSNIPTLLPLR